MIEAYSMNVTVNGGTEIPLNNVSLIKGKSAELQGSASIAINKCGVYRITAYANVTPSAAGTASIQLSVNGALVDHVISKVTAEADTEYTLHIEHILNVPANNNRPCTDPTVFSIVNGLAGTVDLNVILDKIV